MNLKALLTVFVLQSFLVIASESPEELVEAEEAAEIVSFPQCHFSPQSIEQVLVSLIAQENESIRAAYYEFTLFSLAQAWVERKKTQAIFGELLVDKKFQQKITAALLYLHDNEVPLFSVDTDSSLSETEYANMHHKFFIFYDNVGHKKLLVTGSFNCTGSAEEKNWENIVIIDDESVVLKFIEEWKRLNTVRKPISKDQLLEYKGEKKKQYSLSINKIPDDCEYNYLFLADTEKGEEEIEEKSGKESDSSVSEEKEPVKSAKKAGLGPKRIFDRAVHDAVAAVPKAKEDTSCTIRHLKKGDKLNGKCPKCHQHKLRVQENGTTKVLFINCVHVKPGGKYCDFTAPIKDVEKYE
jgi:hypothetical protein